MNAQKFDRYIIIFISNFQNPTVTKNGCERMSNVTWDIGTIMITTTTNKEIHCLNILQFNSKNFGRKNNLIRFFR
ncbi:hypothetical protein DERF_009933 [Dermatophagoides farinae]|uniref:Uncharacterized protein n=1 Tax=Dermatophagoides farinae TaxID=6954 RepID=A0A922HV06_DERFA|nr:hypothetical protein DERF_009933 [Dermatophagoides farinae]